MKILKLLITFICLSILPVQNAYNQENRSYEAMMDKMKEYAWEKKEYEKAIDIGKELLERFPNNTAVEQFLGNLYFYTAQDSLALVFLEKALLKEPDNTDILNSLFHISFKQQNYIAADRYLDRLLGQDEENVEYLIRRAQVYSATGKNKEALTLLNELKKLHPDNEAIKYLLENSRMGQSIPPVILKNSVGVMYRQLMYSGGLDPKKLISGRYVRKQNKATIVATGTYGKHYENEGILLETELYYNHSPKAYSYSLVNWSNKKELFPQLNAGYTYFRNVGKGWVPGLGGRYTHSGSSNVYTVVADVSKYWGNNLTEVRFYGIFDDHKFYRAYNFTHRYNFTTQNYLQFMYTLGTSPDDKTRLVESNLDFMAHSFSLFGNMRLSRHFDARAYFNLTRQKVSPTWKYSIYEIGMELIFNF